MHSSRLRHVLTICGTAKGMKIRARIEKRSRFAGWADPLPTKWISFRLRGGPRKVAPVQRRQPLRPAVCEIDVAEQAGFHPEFEWTWTMPTSLIYDSIGDMDEFR
jgi:hypothetical protein